MKPPVPEADGLNAAEKKGRADRDPQGGAPGIRKRSHYRALKRGESWAVIKQMMDETMREMARKIYFG